MNAEMNAKNTVEGYFRMVAVDAVTGKERLLADWFPNIITDIGLNRLGTIENSQAIGVFFVGTGSATPLASDTQMHQYLANSSQNQSSLAGNVTSGSVYTWQRRTNRFAQGAAAGNLTEVGTGWTVGNSANALFSRTLIKDGGGNPTTIVVLPSEFLDVTYELRMYPPASDSVFNVTIAGVTHTCTMRQAFIGENYPGAGAYYSSSGRTSVSNGSIGAITGGIGGSQSSAMVSPSATTYSNNSLVRDATWSFGLNDANFSGGISAVQFECGGMGKWQCGFSPAIDKTASKLLTLNLRVSWARR